MDIVSEQNRGLTARERTTSLSIDPDEIVHGWEIAKLTVMQEAMELSPRSDVPDVHISLRAAPNQCEAPVNE